MCLLQRNRNYTYEKSCIFALGKSREWPRLVGIWSFRCCLLSRMYGMNPSRWWRRAERWWTGSNDVGFVLCRTLLPVVLAHMTAVTKYCRLFGSKEKKSVAHISGIWKVKRRGTCRFGVWWGHSSFFCRWHLLTLIFCGVKGWILFQTLF